MEGWKGIKAARQARTKDAMKRRKEYKERLQEKQWTGRKKGERRKEERKDGGHEIKEWRKGGG